MITNAQSEEINRIYESRRRQAMDLKNSREKEILEKIPALKEINDTLIDNSFKAARLSIISGNQEALDNLRKSNQLLINTKYDMLQQYGYPKDYLEDVYSCPECKDTGLIKDREGVIISRCQCYIKTIINTFYMSDARRALLARENFQSFNVNYYSAEVIDSESGASEYDTMVDSVNRALDFVDNFRIEYSNVLISGNTGTGKTFLSNCIAKKLIDSGISVLYMPANDFFEYCKKSQFAQGDESKEAGDELDFILEAECLIIDDLGSEVSNSFTNNQLFVLLEKRNLERKPTVITTNLTRQQIKSRYSDRIHSRLLANYKYLKMPGSDIRQKSGINS